MHWDTGQLSALEARLAELRQAHDLAGEAETLSSIAGIYLAQGDADRALATLSRCRAIYEALEDRVGEARTLNNSGVIYQERDEPAQAVPFFELAFRLWGELGDQANLATTAFNLATVYYQMERLEESVTHLEIAVDFHERADHPEAINERAALEQVRGELLLRRAKG